MPKDIQSATKMRDKMPSRSPMSGKKSLNPCRSWASKKEEWVPCWRLNQRLRSSGSQESSLRSGNPWRESEISQDNSHRTWAQVSPKWWAKSRPRPPLAPNTIFKVPSRSLGRSFQPPLRSLMPKWQTNDWPNINLDPKKMFDSTVWTLYI